MDSVPNIPVLWFERLNRRIGWPTWIGAIVIGAGPFAPLGIPFLLQLALSIDISFVVEVYPVSPGVPLLFYSLLMAFGVFLTQFTFYTSRYFSRRVKGLADYARQLSEANPEKGVSLDLKQLSSTRRIAMVSLLLGSFLVPLFTFGGTGSIGDNLIGGLPFLPLMFMLGTFFWTYGYSMFSISKMGKLPMKLRRYGRDKTLGLKPFAAASLSFTLIYLGFLTSTIGIILYGGALPTTLALSLLGFYPVGLLFFFLPLRSLHAKLIDFKVRELAWLEPRAEAAFERWRSEQGTQIDQGIVNELMAIEKVERDIGKIRSWPFDTGIIFRLAAVVLTVVGILLSRIIYTYIVPF